MQIVIDIDKEVYQHMMGNDLLKSVHGNICYKAVLNGTPIPDNATNGEVIKKTFPHYDIEIDEHKGYVRVFYEDFYTTYPWKWWNAKYKGDMPPVQPSLTKESAIDYLHEIGWMQDHDRQITEMGEPKYWIDYYGHVTPMVQPSRKGHWIQIDYQRGKFECSECHTQGYVDTCMYEPIWKYCPKCGAKMGEKNENE